MDNSNPYTTFLGSDESFSNYSFAQLLDIKKENEARLAEEEVALTTASAAIGLHSSRIRNIAERGMKIKAALAAINPTRYHPYGTNETSRSPRLLSDDSGNGTHTPTRRRRRSPMRIQVDSSGDRTCSPGRPRGHPQNPRYLGNKFDPNHGKKSKKKKTARQ